MQDHYTIVQLHLYHLGLLQMLPDYSFNRCFCFWVSTTLMCWTEQGCEREQFPILSSWIFSWNSNSMSVTCAVVKSSDILGDLGACGQVEKGNGRHSREFRCNMLNEKVSVLAQLSSEGQGKGKALWEDFQAPLSYHTRRRWLTSEDPCCAKDCCAVFPFITG